MRSYASPLSKAALLFCAIILLIAQWPLRTGIAAQITASKAELPAYEPLPDFDVRAQSARPGSAVNTEQKKQLLKASRATIQQATLRWNDWLDAPHHLFSLGAPLTAKSGDDAATVARRFVANNRALYGIEPAELDQSRIAALEDRSAFTRLALEQRVNGLRVFDAEMLFILDSDRRMVSVSGSFVPELARRAPDARALLTAEDALRRAAESCGVQLNAPVAATTETLASRERVAFSSDDIDSRSEASLVYYPVSRNDVRLAYQVMLYGVPTPVDSYLILIDAKTAEALRRDALTDRFAAPPGRIFPKESPATCDRALVPLAGDPTSSPQDWVSADRTEGNNARVFYNPDLSGGNTIQANPDGGFDFPLDLTRSPMESSKASATNLFYWVNQAHDWFYALGFDEGSRNFQNDNFGKGGAGGDAVRADTLHGAGLNPSGSQVVRNNAFFSPSLDGTPPLLAMLMWTDIVDGSPVDLDGSYDAGVIVHEYTHGVSTRLSGTDSSLGLRSSQGSSMGEGWSDFFAMSLLTGEDKPLDAPAATGSYVTQRARGVRAYPYCTRFDVDPLTFGDVRFNNEVHAQGTVWCSMLWDMRQLFIQRYGFAGGRKNVDRLVLNGLRVTPLIPSFIDARDAILLADKTTNGGANQDLIWSAFAGRGLGSSATTQLASNGTGYRTVAAESYDLPAEATAGTLTINDRPDAPIVIGETVNLVVSDRDLMNAPSVEIHVKNPRLGSDTTVSLRADDPGHFSATLPVLLPQADGPATRVTAETGDEIVFSYTNARNANGQAETLESHTLAGHRVTLYASDFEQAASGWVLLKDWHLTTRRAASATHSLYFAKSKGKNDNKSFTPVGSSGTAYVPSVQFDTLTRVQLEFDYYFSGAIQPPSDMLTVTGHNAPFVVGAATVDDEPPLGLVYDLRPSSSPGFQNVKVDLHFLGKHQAFLSFDFNASTMDGKRKQYEGFYLDNVRITAVSTQ